MQNKLIIDNVPPPSSSSSPNPNWTPSTSNIPSNYTSNSSAGSSGGYCERRLVTLRSHRTMPYNRPVIKRSPSPYGKSYDIIIKYDHKI